MSEMPRFGLPKPWCDVEHLDCRMASKETYGVSFKKIVYLRKWCVQFPISAWICLRMGCRLGVNEQNEDCLSKSSGWSRRCTFITTLMSQAILHLKRCQRWLLGDGLWKVRKSEIIIVPSSINPISMPEVIHLLLSQYQTEFNLHGHIVNAIKIFAI